MIAYMYQRFSMLSAAKLKQGIVFNGFCNTSPLKWIRPATAEVPAIADIGSLQDFRCLHLPSLLKWITPFLIKIDILAA